VRPKKKGLQFTENAEGNRLTSAVQNSKSQIGWSALISLEKKIRFGMSGLGGHFLVLMDFRTQPAQ
jgi:hypothetical protein